jgi:nitrogen regulatory protein P-II 1
VLKAISEKEHDYSMETGGLVISEVQLSLVVEDAQVDAVTSIIRHVGRVGGGISGYVHVSPIEQVLPIGEASVESGP